MALDSKHAHHQLEAGLPGDEKRQLESQSPAMDFKESRIRRAALRRKMLAFWIIVSSPFICFLMTLVISPLFWPGCLSRLSPGLVYHHEEHAVAQVQADAPFLAAEEEVLDEKLLDVTEELPMTEPRSIVLAKLHRRQDEAANTTSSSSEEETSTEASSTPIDTSTEVSSTTPVDSETSSEVSTPIETSTTTTTSESESTTSESSTTEESSTESTTESTTEVTETSTTPSSTVESETTPSSGTSTWVETTSSSSLSSSSDPTTTSTTSTTNESTTTTAEPTSSTTTSEEQTTTTEERSSTSSPVVATRTETLENGVTTVITSTTWVDVPAPSDEDPDASDPELQNAASKPAWLSLLTVPVAVLAGFALMA